MIRQIFIGLLLFWMVYICWGTSTEMINRKARVIKDDTCLFIEIDYGGGVSKLVRVNTKEERWKIESVVHKPEK